MDESLSSNTGTVDFEGRGIDFCLKIRIRSALAVSEPRFGRSCLSAEFRAEMKSICGKGSSSRSGKYEAFMA